MQEHTPATHMDVRNAGFAGAHTCDSHGCEKCRFRRSTYLSRESAGAGVFAVGTSGDRLIERFREPGEAAKPQAASDEPVGIAEQGQFLQAAAHVINYSVHGCRKQAHQRVAISSSIHWAAAAGSIRKTTWTWLLMTA